MSKIKPTLIGGVPNNLEEIDKKVIVYVDQYGINLTDYNHTDYDYKIYWQIESNGVIMRKENNISFPIQNKDKFDLILASDPLILSECDNSVLLPFGSCWIPINDQKIHKKTKMVSIIASSKRVLPGHQLRHNIMASIGDKMDIFGRCCNYIENKADALRDYKFNVCIENLQNTNWFTEKLIDCLRTGTIPIYWGCPNIGDYFNTDGFIIVNTYDEIVNVINNLSDDDYYSRKSSIEENFYKSDYYGDKLFNRVDYEIKKIINE